MSIARRHRDRILAAQTIASAPNGGAAIAPAAGLSTAAGANSASNTPAARAAAQIALRLTHDLRRLKEIKAVSLKVEAKRQMLPEYRDWLIGLVAADAGVGTGTAAEVAPTVMVWMIDTGYYGDAINLGEFLLRHRVAMPSRYNRDVATVLVEEIADAALKAQAADAPFDLGVLDSVDGLTIGIDMHDEVRAKLAKAIGAESLRALDSAEATASLRPAIENTLFHLRRAQGLHDRIGVKDKIKRAEKLLATNIAAFPPEAEQAATEQGDASAA
jgi:hypothetical protein